MFLPAAGGCNYGGVFGQGDRGDCWSCTPGGSSLAYYLYFNSGYQNVGDDGRFYGYSVRAVLAEHLSDKTILIVI